MQDNSKYRQQLIDKGWGQMSTLLDKEMPQSGKRRRTAIWWVVGAGIALILLGWSYFLLRSDTEEQPFKQAEELPKFETAMSTTSGQPQLQKTEPLTQSGIQGSVGEPGVSDAIADMSHLHPIATKSFPAPRQTSKPLAVKENARASATSEDSEFHAAPEDISTVVGMERSSESDPNAGNIAITSRVEAREVAVLARLDRNSIEDPDAPLDGFPSIEVNTRIPRKFAVDALAATHMNADGNPFYGVEAGLSATLKSGRRFSFNAGLTYGYYNTDGLEFLGFSKDQELELDNTNNPGQNTGYLYDVNALFSHSLAVSEVKQITEKFHYVHLPVSLGYAISPRLAAALGVKISTLISAPARYKLNDTRFSSSPLSNASRDFLVSYDILRKWDIAPMASLSYRVSQKFAIDASYTHGLVHYVNSSGPQDRSDLHRSGSLGVRYRLF